MNQEILVITTNKLLNENEIISIYIDFYNKDYEYIYQLVWINTI